MRRNGTSGRNLLLFLVLLLLQSGCASKIPSTLPLAESEKVSVLDRLREFQGRNCSQSLDADVTLEWLIYGKTEKIPGLLQLQSPAFLRYAVVDPLGRQLFILVSDGISFTLVDNRNAKALIGQVDSQFWKKYIPGFVIPTQYLSWLTGRLPAGDFKTGEIRADKRSVDAVWLITGWNDAIRHHVLFSPEAGQVLRHIIEGGNHEILLDVVYSDYDSTDQGCAPPHRLQVEGAGISGTVTLLFEEIFPAAPIPRGIFHLTLPDHFTVSPVE